MSCCCGNRDSKSERILKGFEKRPAEFGYQLSLPEASVQLRLKLAGKTHPMVSASPGGTLVLCAFLESGTLQPGFCSPL